MKKHRKTSLLRPMSDRTFRITAAVLLAVCCLVTVVLLVYTAYAYHYVSIIRFIAGERW